MSKLAALFAPARVAVYLTTAGGAATAAATVLETAGDTQSTTGLLVAYGGAVAAVVKWLDGRQKFEAREAEEAKQILAAVSSTQVAEPPPTERTDVPAAEVVSQL